MFFHDPNVTTIHRDYPDNRAKDVRISILWPALINSSIVFSPLLDPNIGLAKGSKSEHPLPDCQGSHDVSWLHSDREKDCGLKIPLTSTAKFQLDKSSPLTSTANFQLEKSSPVDGFPKVFRNERKVNFFQ